MTCPCASTIEADLIYDCPDCCGEYAAFHPLTPLIGEVRGTTPERAIDRLERMLTWDRDLNGWHKFLEQRGGYRRTDIQVVRGGL